MTENDKGAVLKLKHNSLLNWRSIIFGFYFVILAFIGSYLLKLNYGSATDLFFTFLFTGSIAWILVDEIKYSKIEKEIKNIEEQIAYMK